MSDMPDAGPTGPVPDEDVTLPLAATAGVVKSRLTDDLAARRATYGGIDPSVDATLGILEDFVLSGGKRVRPTFAWAGVRLALDGGGADDAHPAAGPLLTACASLEYIQACALIHDDIIDRSDSRRGRPTVHRRVAALHREAGWHGSAEHYGVSQAILTGDLAFAWADDMLAGSGVGPAALARAREPWRVMRSEVIIGQILDIAVENRRSEDPADPDKVNLYKTAAYTVERPLHLGAALVGAPEATVALLRAVGREIGVAFQLQDDMLGVFGDPGVTGKPSGDDLRSGKRTYLVSRALRAADAADPAAAAVLREGLGEVTDDAGVDRLRQVIVDSGAAAEVDARIHDLTGSALTRLTGGPFGDDVTRDVVTLAETLTTRTA
ncbi:polyprenyl synthetase family protein [Corynebacterium bovis]|uniref:polyprenyl synthetase family protein n=1 Tax=Corynebacterium bovis TaxID=36808 RepID=UPI000F648F02|nr:polyprenyl synthetase family protein [Corynebacterium bovis]RRO82000.1 geranylgeranyl pyrophosphate synthase [Corynebacterium bovis]RRO82741.1 geranylgeranyl pyrophosphate synthase [Corynebacterium bovis]RRO84174.1 geranylgeranyl pyrophosphate synthase [Corynebacterium bovis]RRO91373.1 geranylgeranyl pyrophosphate synthase [Corynebacterium bovis]